ncbi:MAG: hypothetical protein AAGA46_02570 [Cyanobacteria bacterium P01_F01_bin.13]
MNIPTDPFDNKPNDTSDNEFTDSSDNKLNESSNSEYEELIQDLERFADGEYIVHKGKSAFIASLFALVFGSTKDKRN